MNEKEAFIHRILIFCCCCCCCKNLNQNQNHHLNTHTVRCCNFSIQPNACFYMVDWIPTNWLTDWLTENVCVYVVFFSALFSVLYSVKWLFEIELSRISWAENQWNACVLYSHWMPISSIIPDTYKNSVDWLMFWTDIIFVFWVFGKC